MSRKSSSKGQGQTPSAAPRPKARATGTNPVIWGALAVAIIVVGIVVLRPSGTPDTAAPGEPAASAASATTPQAPQATAAAIARAEALAALGPRRQTSLPPIPFQGYTPPRPVEVVTSAYQFAADHPEILTYVPCFCGCEQAGHSGSHDCFVKARNADGDVTEWDEHGVTCAVCIDVANRSRQLHASGATAPDIRAAIDKEFSPVYPGRMPTPMPHSH